MNSHPYKKTALTASILIVLSGAFGSMAGADPACNQDNTQTASTGTNVAVLTPSAELAEPTDAELTDLPDKINSIFDKLESANDVKYYSFTALREQKVMINHIQQAAENSYWKIEYNIGAKWQPAPTFDSIITPTLPVG